MKDLIKDGDPSVLKFLDRASSYIKNHIDNTKQPDRTD